MLAIDSRAKTIVGVAWLLFASLNCYLTFALAGEETIPYHLVWASFALVYGLCPWPRVLTWVVFCVITVVTGIALVGHATSGIIHWEECSEVLLMGVILLLLIWHVNRQWAARDRLLALQAVERERTEKREIAARFGSHEVRTRLTIARGYAQLIADSSIETTVREDAGLVVGELVKASALATNLLTLVRVVQPSPRSRLDMDELIQIVLRRWSVTAMRRWGAACDVGFILGDAERFEATLDCLLENAVKFTDTDDEISISAHLVDEELVLSVTDSGSGIPPEDVPTIFDLFKTSSSAGERAGSGLGLAIVRAITEARGGTVDVVSTVGVGTTFTIRFPAVRASADGDHPVPHRAIRESAVVIGRTAPAASAVTR
jgi:signal transduction histidine kinase